MLSTSAFYSFEILLAPYEFLINTEGSTQWLGLN